MTFKPEKPCGLECLVISIAEAILGVIQPHVMPEQDHTHYTIPEIRTALAYAVTTLVSYSRLSPDLDQTGQMDEFISAIWDAFDQISASYDLAEQR